MAEIVIPYKPRDIFRPYHQRKQRFALIVAHRRAGKTVAEVNECIRRVLTVKRRFPPPQVAFVSPTFKQGRRNAWPYVKHYAGTIPGVRFRETDLTVEFPNGGRLLLVGSDDPDALRGMYLDHVAMDEFGDQRPRVWGEIIRPTLSDYGGSATFIGTPKGHNHFYRLYQQHRNDPNWFVAVLRASETGIIPPEELELARKTMSPAQYEQEYECSFEAAVPGLIYAEFIKKAEQEGRITRVPHDPSVPVFAAWDLGMANPMAIWIGQRVGLEYHFLQYREFTGESMLQVLEWVKSLPYRVDVHLVPHDARARELTTGETRLDFMRAHGFRAEVVPRHHLWDGIHRVQSQFQYMWFDAEQCEAGLDALRMYRKKHDDRTGRILEDVEHDWASHGADALRYAVMGQSLLGYAARRPEHRQVAVI